MDLLAEVDALQDHQDVGPRLVDASKLLRQVVVHSKHLNLPLVDVSKLLLRQVVVHSKHLNLPLVALHVSLIHLQKSSRDGVPH